jgi:hypothetical protein
MIKGPLEDHAAVGRSCQRPLWVTLMLGCLLGVLGAIWWGALLLVLAWLR